MTNRLKIVSGFFVLFSIFSASVTAAGEPDMDPKTGYRINNYMDPTPETAPGTNRISLSGLQKMLTTESPVLVDVFPVSDQGPDPLDGTWTVTRPHHNIPGSIWLPNTGFGFLTPEMLRYLTSNLRHLSEDRKDAAIVIYCLDNCWGSWNAAKRAAELGYTNIYWFKEGTDAWKESGRPLALAKPVPVDVE